MSNLLKMALIESIRTLHRRGWSQRRIARELGVDRETVARYLRTLQASSKPASAPIGSDGVQHDPKPAAAPIGSDDAPPDSKPATAPIGSDGATAVHPSDVAHVDSPLARMPVGSPRPQPPPPRNPSGCEPWREVIQAKLDLGLSAQRILQDLTTEHGFTGSYYSVRRFVHRLEESHELPFRRIECDPGDEAQIDFGAGAPIIGADGKRRKTHVLRVVLSHSRKAYSEAVFRQTTDDFLRCLEGAFRHFGGVPGRLILDNLKAAVKKADWFDPEINPKVRSFGEYYGTVFIPTRPYTPRHKGKVERGVDYVQENALKGKSFASLEDQNLYLRDWELSVADTRVHGTTRRQVGKHFLEVERARLLALPIEPFPSFHEVRRAVHRDGHVEVDRAYYSVPPEYVTRQVWVRWDGRVVRIFNDRMQQIAIHAKREPGQFSTHRQHIASEKISGVERGSAWLLGQVRRLGPHCTKWAEGVISSRGVEGVRVVQGLLSLAHRHPVGAIEHACEIAQTYGSHRLKTIRVLIDRDAARQEVLPFVDEHPIIRRLSDYSEFVHNAFQKGGNT